MTHDIAQAEPWRFGWRVWTATPDQRPALRSPFWSTRCESQTFVAQCIHGNTPPVPQCKCGIHYVPQLDDFLRGVAYVNGPHYPPMSLPKKRTVFTYGWTDSDPVLEDAEPTGWGGGMSFRASRFHILGLLIPSTATYTRTLQLRYRAPVVKGLDAETATELVDHIHLQRI